MTWFGGSNLSLSSDGIAVYTRPPEAHGRDTLPQPPSHLPPLSRNSERLGWIFGIVLMMVFGEYEVMSEAVMSVFKGF